MPRRAVVAGIVAVALSAGGAAACTDDAVDGSLPPPTAPATPSTTAVAAGPSCEVDEYAIVDRVVPDDGAPLRAALDQLLLGVTPAEAAAGMRSSFSSYNAGQVLGVAIDDGVATITLTPGFVVTNNFSTSGLGDAVLGQLEATVFQFDGVRGIELVVDGARWCGWENPCEAVPAPLRQREQDFAPAECVDAWRTGALAPTRCEEHTAADELYAGGR